MKTERIDEITTINYRDNEDENNELLIMVAYQMKQGDSIKGKVRVHKLLYSKKKGSYEFQQVAPASDFPF